MNKLTSLKNKIVARRHEIALGAVCVAYVGLVAGTIYAGYKAMQAEQAVIDEALAAGKTVLPGPDGMLWIIDNPENVTTV